MSFHYAGLAWLHFVFAFLMVGMLVAEVFVLRLPVDARVGRLLLRIDLFYGISAVLILSAGVARVIWGESGWSYYEAQPFFWAKIATFAVIGLISIIPTRAFLRWNKAFRDDPGFVVPEPEAKRIRVLVTAEAHSIVLLLLFASFMARGIGGA